MKTLLTAKEIVQLAWSNHTWPNDRTVKVGKLSANVAYEIVHQPSKDINPYKVSRATYNPETGEAKGEYLDNFPLLSNALDYVIELKEQERV